jgi:uncharacterized protein (UPF0332 family)
MSFDWAEYLSLAEELQGVPVSGPLVGIEAKQRASVSRAYYSAFILARNRLRDVDLIPIPHTGGAHQFVAQRYARDPDPRRSQIGILLGRLRSVRNMCDYDDTVPQLSLLSPQALGWAAQVVADLGRL